MQRCDQGHLESPDEIDEIPAVLAAPDPTTVLEADHLDAAVVQGMGDVGVVGLGIAPDSMANLGRIRPGLARRMKGHDLTLADRGGQIVGEGRDAALAR